MARKKNSNKLSGKTQISISLPLNLVAKIDELADVENRNRSNFIATELEKLADDAELIQANEPKAMFNKAKKKVKK